jgi:protease-4
MKLSSGWTFLGILKNIFFLLIFLQILPFLIAGIKSGINQVVSDKTEVGYLCLRDAITDSAFYTKRIQDFETNPLIEGLIIKVESPGGMPGSSQAIFRELCHFKTKKPVIAFIENCGASGAYYAVCGASKIIANPSAIVGSIGAVLRVPNVKHLLESWKVTHTLVQAGDYKTALDPFKDVKQSEVEFLQKMADDTYDQFIADVAQQRGLDKASHKIWADGKIFTGNQAKQLKLVDDLGSYRDALDAMAVLLKVDSDDLKLVTGSRGVRAISRYFSDEDDFGAEISSSLAVRMANFCVKMYQQSAMQVGAEQPQLHV